MTARKTALMAVAFAVTACAHTRPIPAAPRHGVSGLEAVKAWYVELEARSSTIEIADRTWWIAEGPRRELERLVFTEQSVPRTTSAHARWATLQLTRCIVYDFVPLMLRQADESKWDQLSDELEALSEAKGDWVRHVWFRALSAWSHHRRSALSPDREHYARLRGELQDRPPSTEEIAIGLLFRALAVSEEAGHAGMVDPGDHLHDQSFIEADVPLILAPLYAISAGVDREQVRIATQRCFDAMSAN